MLLNSLLKNSLAINLKYLRSIWVPLVTTERGAKRGYRGRTNACRKKKVTKEDNSNLVKTKNFNIKKKRIYIDDTINPNDNEYIDFLKRKPLDNIYLSEKYPIKIYNLKEAIETHKEVASPEIYDNLDGLFYVKLRLNMATPKKNKCVPPISGILMYQNTFDFPTKFNNRILAFASKASEQENAIEAGALMSGGKDMVKKVIKGQVKRSDFDHVICTADFVPEIVGLRGILGKGLFPSVGKGSVGDDLASMVERFSKSVSYATTYPYGREDVAIVDCMLAKVARVGNMCSAHELGHMVSPPKLHKIGMPSEEIYENFKTLIDSVMFYKPATTETGDFITRAHLRAPPSPEILELELSEFMTTPAVESDQKGKQNADTDLAPESEVEMKG